MKILLSFALIFVFGFNSFASPLVYKITPEIDSKSELIDVGVFDATDYRQIRIGTFFTPKTPDDKQQQVVIYAVEGNEEIYLADNKKDASFYIDSPPQKIKIKVQGRGKFSIYIWGTQK